MASSSPPVAIVCVGMAGSGKTTFMQRINSYLHTKRDAPYVINLDPAVHNVPYDSNIDIRDSLNYKEVMREYKLGPNGGILTSLNIFATKIDQVMGILEKRTKQNPEVPSARMIKNIIVDTPGQIEVFVWSASGSILLDSLASAFPTVIAYIIDTPRSSSTNTFMSNMLYACSILYKTKLPMILVFNKTDVRDADFAKEWMTDFEVFQAAVNQEQENGSFGGVEGASGAIGGGSGYMGSLLNSMSLMLDEFYRHLHVVGVSSMTGNGVKEFFEAVGEKAKEFERDYRPELERRQREREKSKHNKQEQELGRLMKDMNVAPQKSAAPNAERVAASRKTQIDTISDIDSDEEMRNAERGGESDEEVDDDETASTHNNLGARYKKALEDEGGSAQGPSSEDHSFTRYLRASNLS